ncbi:MAG: hypothetical protein AAGJ10_11765 [Bacteroidota bacterium]
MTYLDRVREQLPYGIFAGIGTPIVVETNFLTTWSLDHFLSLSPGWLAFQVIFIAVFFTLSMAWWMPGMPTKRSRST